MQAFRHREKAHNLQLVRLVCDAFGDYRQMAMSAMPPFSLPRDRFEPEILIRLLGNSSLITL